MKKQPKRISPLAQVEIQALAAGREWTRRKIERDLQKLADQQGEISPLSGRPLIRCHPTRLVLRTSTGTVQVETFYGQDPEHRCWLNPLRELWGLSSHQELTPVFEEKLCYTATMSGSYESAARVAAQ